MLTMKYTTIKLPKDLGRMIDHEITLHPMGFNSRTEFVKYAIRRFLDNEGGTEGKP